MKWQNGSDSHEHLVSYSLYASRSMKSYPRGVKYMGTEIHILNYGCSLAHFHVDKIKKYTYINPKR